MNVWNFFEYEQRLKLCNEILDAEAFKIRFIESLILAQDERWRRA